MFSDGKRIRVIRGSFKENCAAVDVLQFDVSYMPGCTVKNSRQLATFAVIYNLC